jgi:hypothetical protein
MIYKGDIGLYLSGGPVVVPWCGIYITQPRIKDISQFGEQSFFMALSLLTKTDRYAKDIKKGNSQLEDMSDFQILMLMVEAQPMEIKPLMDKFFKLVCPSYKVKYSKNTMDFFQDIDGESRRVGQITPFNFERLQLVIRELFSVESSDEDYNPANEKAEEIMRKIQAGKDKIAAQRGQTSTTETTSLFGTYISILSVGMNMDMNVLYNYTPFQIYDTFNRYTAKMADDFYRKIATTPLMDVSKMDEPDPWTKNLYATAT